MRADFLRSAHSTQNRARLRQFPVPRVVQQTQDTALITPICDEQALGAPVLGVGREGKSTKGALRGTPGSACPQPEPNATELPSCAPISARTAQR